MSLLRENLRYTNRIARRDYLYDCSYVDEVLNSEEQDEQEMFKALKYAHRFAKREPIYDEEYIQSFIDEWEQ